MHIADAQTIAGVAEERVHEVLRGMTRPKSAEFLASQVGVGIGVALRRILSTLTLAQQVMR